MADFLLVAPVVALGVLAPILALARGLRFVGWTYLALIPLFMYHKSMFSLLTIGGKQIQWVTLSKDFVALLLLVFPVVYFLLKPGSFSTILTARQRSALVMLSLFAAYFVSVALALGNGPGQTMMGIRPYLFYAFVGLALAAWLLRNKNDWDTLTRILQFGCALIAVIALIQNYVDEDFLIHPSFQSLWHGETLEWQPGKNRLRGIFTAANTLGYFMALGIGISVWRLLRGADRLYSSPREWGLLGVFCWVLVLTLSRSALLGAACMVGLLLLARMRTAFRLPFVIAGGIAVVGFVLLTPYGERFQNLADNPRLVIWYAYVSDTLQSPLHTLVGKGVGTLGRYGVETSVGTVRLEELASKIGGEGEIFVVDNFFVRSFYETGLLGFAMLLWIVILWYRHWSVVGATTKPWTERAHHAFAFALMGFVMLISIFSDSFGTFPWNMLFWMAAAGSVWGPRTENSGSAARLR